MPDPTPRQINDSPERLARLAPQGTIEMPAEKAYFLMRAEVLQEAKDDLASWFRRRFWIGVIVLSLVGFFGGNTLIKETIRERTEDKILKALMAAGLAEQQADAARTAVKQATTQAETYRQTVAKLQLDAETVQLDLTRLREQIQADTGNVKARAEQDVRDITARVRQLEELVAKVAVVSEAGLGEIEAYRSDLDKLRTISQAERQRFTTNSEYRVIIYYTEATKESARKAQEKLIQEGYRVASDDLKQAIQSYRTLATLRTPQPKANTISSARVATTKAAEIQQLLAPIVAVKSLIEFEEVATVVRPLGELAIHTPPNEIYVYLVST